MYFSIGVWIVTMVVDSGKVWPTIVRSAAFSRFYSNQDTQYVLHRFNIHLHLDLGGWSVRISRISITTRPSSLSWAVVSCAHLSLDGIGTISSSSATIRWTEPIARRLSSSQSPNVGWSITVGVHREKIRLRLRRWIRSTISVWTGSCSIEESTVLIAKVSF